MPKGHPRMMKMITKNEFHEWLRMVPYSCHSLSFVPFVSISPVFFTDPPEYKNMQLCKFVPVSILPRQGAL
jgi:hypothetical protein